MPGGIYWQVASKGTIQFYGDHHENPVMGWSQPPTPSQPLWKNNSCRNWLALPSPVFCEMVIFNGIIKLSRLREWSCSIHYMGSNMSSPARLALTVNECYGCERFIFMHGSEIDLALIVQSVVSQDMRRMSTFSTVCIIDSPISSGTIIQLKMALHQISL